MKKILLLIAVVLGATTMNAQDMYGEATYMSKVKIDNSWTEGDREMTPERRKRIEENMKKMTEKTFVLKFNRTESTYKEEVALEAPGQGRGFGGFLGTMLAGEKYKNVTEGMFVEQRDMMGKTFLIKDSLPLLEWKITGESRKIGNYTAIKATATMPSGEFDWSNFRRRRGENAEEQAAQKKKDSIAQATGDPTEMFEKPDEIVVTAWFTPEIPVQHGPDVYGGLPGLILEVNAGNTTLLCSQITINPEERDEIKPEKKGEEVTQAEYDAILKEKMEAFRQRGRGGRGGRGGR
ncbi:GLPGLI family protein [Nonlabens ulvanivorans]|uniref:GLPGLI family protein n=1 Tax=Nonlabens ulvanivorans TaxID=906888 RepID=UPI002943BD5A|nr:GLPGLI family protein [Nonlabens ulvanivorans]WOI21996.1 GLPGLI family protein [Nonlabens ulvanivorans]